MISTTTMPIIVTGKTQLANHLVEAIDSSRAGEILDLTDDDHLVIITQGTARGGVKTIIDRCYTDIVSQIESVNRKDLRYIVIGSMSAEYTSYPGISNLAMIYANAKRSLSQYVSDYNQMNMDMDTKSVGGHRIQICEPASFQTGMSNYKGLEVSKVIDAVQYLIAHPEVVKIQLRQ